MLMSGERLKSLQQSGQSVFGNYYENYMNRLQGISSQGIQATNAVQQIKNNNLNSLVSYRSGQKGGGMAGDLMGAAASIGGTMFGSKK